MSVSTPPLPPYPKPNSPRRSRLIFHNLPPTLPSDPTSFRAHLTAPPSLSDTTITDVKLVPKRRFAFVGYRTAEDAQRVQKWFNESFAFGAGKVKVEVLGEEPLAERPKKKTKVINTKSAAATPDLDANAGGEDADVKQGQAGPSMSKRLQEFMDVMKGVDPSAPVAETSAAGAAGLRKKQEKGRKGKERSTSATPEPSPADDDDDAAWLARRKGRLEVDDVSGEGGEASTRISLTSKITHDPDAALILSTGRLFLRNLSFLTTSSDITSLFTPYGALEDVHLPVAKTGEPLGTAFVLFREPSAALAAWRGTDRKAFQGRLLHVLPGRARPGQAKDLSEVTDGKVLGKVKDTRGEVLGKKEEKRKEETARGVNWASLYLNSDAVAASVADKMGISKSELLTGDASSSAAVKLALAETAVIADTKSYFASEGIVIDSLSPKTPRSQTILLIKNIPPGTTLPALADLFSPHGTLTRLLLPPSGALGVAEYAHAHEAQSAFKALSYKRLGSAVLYLEKGPQGMFTTPGEGVRSAEEKERAALALRAAEASEDVPTASASVDAGADADATPREAPAESDESGSTLFLKNLAFSTTSARLASVLSSLPSFSFARVQTKPDPKRPGERLSMGYGFVGFATRDAARRGMRALEGFEVDGKRLEVRLAQRGAEDDDAAAGAGRGAGKDEKGEAGAGKKSAKVLVKNLPFEASKKDVRELFSAYGTLKSLRLPRKSTLTPTGAASSRGFAFLEYTTHAEAARAIEALKHTHLLGRHLVLQWANEGEGVDVDKLREKVGRDVRGMAGDKLGVGAGGKRKFELEGAAGAGGEEEMDGLDG